MQNSGIVGFSYDYTRSSYDRIELNKGDVQRRMSLVVEDGMSLAEKQALAEPWLQRAGYDPSQLELVTREGEPRLRYVDPESKIGDSRLEHRFTFEQGKLRSYEPSFRSRPPIPPMSTSRPKMPRR